MNIPTTHRSRSSPSTAPPSPATSSKAIFSATAAYPGLIRTAREGPLFLDEIGELGLDLQPKLLRFLESGEISPLGEPGPTRVKVRIVAATNQDLAALVQAGRFREDLFYRLN